MKPITLKTYNEFWKFERVIYTIGDIKLLFPITMSGVLYFFVGEIIIHLLLRFSLTSWIQVLPIIGNGLVLRGALPIIFMLFMMRYKLDGKFPIVFAMDWVSFLAASKRYDGLNSKNIQYGRIKNIHFKTHMRRETAYPKLEVQMVQEIKKNSRFTHDYKRGCLI